MPLHIDATKPKPERLLLAAEYVIATEGVAESSFKDAALLAGASPTSYQYYFGHSEQREDGLANAKAGVVSAVIEFRMDTYAQSSFRYLNALSETIGRPILTGGPGERTSIHPDFTPSSIETDNAMLALLLPWASSLYRETGYWCQFSANVYDYDPSFFWACRSSTWRSLYPSLRDLFTATIKTANDREFFRNMHCGLVGMSILEAELRDGSLSRDIIPKEVALIALHAQSRYSDTIMQTPTGKKASLALEIIEGDFQGTAP